MAKNKMVESGGLEGRKGNKVPLSNSKQEVGFFGGVFFHPIIKKSPILLLVTMAIATESQFHVLAVDDSLIDRKLIERLLKTSSFQVTTVDSGSKALEFLGLHDEKSSPDQHEIEVSLIITDYCMPEMTGYDLLLKIKESSSLKDIPVVIMSSENVPSRINRCLEGGAEEFLLKPVKLSDMNRLRPHILKGKNKDQPQQQQQQNEQQQPNSNGSNKRKAASDDDDDDEGLSPVRTRPRFSNGSTLTVL